MPFDYSSFMERQNVAQNPLQYSELMDDTLNVINSNDYQYQLGSYLQKNNIQQGQTLTDTDYDRLTAEDYALYSASQGSYDADKEKKNSLDFAKTLAQQGRLSENMIVPFAFANYKKATSDTFYINGVPSLDSNVLSKLVSNPNVSALTLAKISNGLDMIAGDKNNLSTFGTVTSTFKSTEAQDEASEQYGNYELNAQQTRDIQRKAQLLYESENSNALIKFGATFVAEMAQAYKRNPLSATAITVASAITAQFTAGKSIALGFGAIQALRDFNSARESVALEADLARPELSQQDALNSYQALGSGTTNAFLDVATFGMMGKALSTAGTKALEQFITKEQKTAKVLEKSKIAKALPTEAETLAKHNHEYLKGIGAQFLENTAMMETAGLTQQIATNSLSNKDLTNNLGNVAKESFKQGLGLSAMSTVGFALKYPFSRAKIIDAYAKLSDKAQHDVVNTTLNEQTKDLNSIDKARVVKDTGLMEVKFDKTDIQKMAEENDIDLSQSWIADKMNKTPDGETVSVPLDEYLSHSKEGDFELFEELRHDSDEGISKQEAEQTFSPETQKELDAEYQDFLNKTVEENEKDVNERSAIEADVMTQVRKAVPTSNSEQARSIGSYIASIWEFVSDLTGDGILESYNGNKAKIKREMTPRYTDGYELHYLGIFTDDGEAKVTDKGDNITALHEVVHYSLTGLEYAEQRLREKLAVADEATKPQLEKNYKKVKSILDSVYGDDYSHVEKGSEQWRTANEKFVAQMMLDIVSGHAEAPAVKDFYKALQKMIINAYAIRARHSDRTSRMTPKQKQTNAIEQINNSFSSIYNQQLYVDDPVFNQFAKDLFDAQKEADTYDGLYIGDSVDTLVNSKGEKIKLDDEIVNKVKAERESFRDWLVNFRSKASATLFAFGQKLDSEFSKLLKSNKEASKFFREQGREFKQDFLKAYKEMKNTLKDKPEFKFLLELKEHPFNRDEMKGMLERKQLTKREYKQLEKDGFLSDDGETLTAKSAIYKGVSPRRMLSSALQIRTPNAYLHRSAFTKALKDYKRKVNDRFANGKVKERFYQTFGNILRYEHQLINKMKGTLDKPSFVKYLANRAIQDSKVFKHSDRYYMSQAQRLRQKAQACLKKGDLKGADDYYRASRITAELAFANTRTRNIIEKQSDRVKRLVSKGREDLFKQGYDNDTLDLVRTILDRTGLGNNFKGDLDKVRARAKDDPIIQMAVDLFDSFDKSSLNKKYTELTTAEIEKIHNTIEGLVTLSRQQREVILDNKKYDREQVIHDIANQIQFEHRIVNGKVVLRLDENGNPIYKKNKAPDRRLKNGGAGLTAGWLTKKILGIDASAKAIWGKIEQWVYTIDGEMGGTLHTLFFTPVRRALARSTKTTAEFKNKYQAVLNKAQESYSLGQITSNLPDVRNGGAPIVFGAGNSSAFGCGQAEILGLLTHIGNDSNFSKLCEGYGWTPQQVLTFVQDCVDKGIITKEMLEACNELWAINKEAFIRGDKAYYQVHGIHPKELEPRPVIVNMPDGSKFTLTGGYMPIVTNKSVSVAREKTQLSSKLDNINEYGRHFVDGHPALADGWGKERKNLKDQPAISFDLAELCNKGVQVASYADLAPTIHNVQSVFNSQEIKNAFKDTDPDNYHAYVERLMLEACNSTVNRIQGDPLDNGFFHSLIAQVGQSLMALNPTVAVGQLAGLSASLTYVRPKYLMRGLFLWGQKYKDTIDMLAKADPFFYERLIANQSHLQETVQSLLVTKHARGFLNSILYNHGRLSNLLSEKFAYAMLKWVQDRVDVATAYGAYMQEMDKAPAHFKTEADADAFMDKAMQKASQIVRMTQSSSNRVDKAGVENSSAITKMFMQFQNYFFNVIQTEIAEAKRCKAMDMDVKERVARNAYVLTTLVVMPAFLNGLISRVAHGDTENITDLQELLTMTAKETAKTYTHGLIPIVGGMFDNTIERAGGKNKKNYRGTVGISSPATSALTNAVNGVSALIQGDFKAKNARDILYLTTDVLKLGSLNSLFKRGFQSYDSRKSTPEDTIRMLITGYQSDKQKAK